MSANFTFVDGVVAAHPVQLFGNLEPITGNTTLHPNLAMSYDQTSKTLVCEAHLYGRRIEIHGIDCLALEYEAIAAGVLRPLERSGYHKFTPRVGTAHGFHSNSSATMLRVMVVKATVNDGGCLELPADAYLGIFPTKRDRPADNLFRLRALVGGDLGDIHVDIVVSVPDLLMALTRVGHFEAISQSDKDCVVSLRRRLVTSPSATPVN